MWWESFLWWQADTEQRRMADPPSRSSLGIVSGGRHCLTDPDHTQPRTEFVDDDYNRFKKLLVNLPNIHQDLASTSDPSLRRLPVRTPEWWRLRCATDGNRRTPKFCSSPVCCCGTNILFLHRPKEKQRSGKIIAVANIRKITILIKLTVELTAVASFVPSSANSIESILANESAKQASGSSERSTAFSKRRHPLANPQAAKTKK